jgi:ATP-grasp domain
VEAVCPSRHPIASTTVVQRLHSYNGLTPLLSFMAAIAASKPDLIVPGDDIAVRHLHDLYRRQRRGKAALCELIERSIGAPESHAIVYARTAFIETAKKEGVRTPETATIRNPNDLKTWITRAGLPTVLKADGTSGGDGVRIAHTRAEAESALRSLAAPPLLARAGKRAVVDGDTRLVWPALARRRSIVSAQAFVAGREATSTVACWKGAVLASLHFEVLNKAKAAGHATVVRRIENSEMATASEQMVRTLKLSGMHGFDFMLETNTGNAYLIEMNPRATQVGHLALGQGHDLAAALYGALSGEATQAAPKVTENDTIALFPQEWTRDPLSAFLQSAYHDVPWDQPELLDACVRSRSRQKAWYSRPAPASFPSEASRLTVSIPGEDRGLFNREITP